MNRLWKKLDIDSLPKKFFTRDDLCIKMLKSPGNWVYDPNTKIGKRAQIIDKIQNYGGEYKVMVKPHTQGKITITNHIKQELDGEILEGCEVYEYYYVEGDLYYEVEIIG